MATRRILALLLVGLVLVASLPRIMQGAAAPSTTWHHLAWNGFLFWLPLILAGFLLGRARWVLMAGVMYGTIGLALDISTIVQALTRSEPSSGALMLSGATGLLNFLLIVFGGRGFLEVSPAVTLRATPPEAPPPSPPSPSANESVLLSQSQPDGARLPSREPRRCSPLR